MSDAAIIDAVGGSTAAALSVVIFYPLELLRVHMQSQLGGSSNASTGAGTSTDAETASGTGTKSGSASDSVSPSNTSESPAEVVNGMNTETHVVASTSTSAAAHVHDIRKCISAHATALLMRILAALRPVLSLLRRLQAQLRHGISSPGRDSRGSTQAGGAYAVPTIRQAQVILVRHLKGLLLRVAHTLITSFVYYQTYGVAASWWSKSSSSNNSSSQTRRSGCGNGAGKYSSGGLGKQPPAPQQQLHTQRTLWGNLGASTAAAMLTVLVSLPLEAMVLHAQRKGQKEGEREGQGEAEVGGK